MTPLQLFLLGFLLLLGIGLTIAAWGMWAMLMYWMDERQIRRNRLNSREDVK